MSGEKGEYYRKIFYKLFDSFLFCFLINLITMQKKNKIHQHKYTNICNQADIGVL